MRAPSTSTSTWRGSMPRQRQRLAPARGRPKALTLGSVRRACSRFSVPRSASSSWLTTVRAAGASCSGRAWRVAVTTTWGRLLAWASAAPADKASSAAAEMVQAAGWKSGSRRVCFSCAAASAARVGLSAAICTRLDASQAGFADCCGAPISDPVQGRAQPGFRRCPGTSKKGTAMKLLKVAPVLTLMAAALCVQAQTKEHLTPRSYHAGPSSLADAHVPGHQPQGPGHDAGRVRQGAADLLRALRRLPRRAAQGRHRQAPHARHHPWPRAPTTRSSSPTAARPACPTGRPAAR